MRGMLIVACVLALVAWYPAIVEAQCTGEVCPVAAPSILAAAPEVVGDCVPARQPVRRCLRVAAAGVRAIVQRQPVRTVGRAVLRPVRRVACRLRRRC